MQMIKIKKINFFVQKSSLYHIIRYVSYVYLFYQIYNGFLSYICDMTFRFKDFMYPLFKIED